MPESVKPGRIIMGRLQRGDDLLLSLERICSDRNIRLGEIRAIGAVEHAKIAYYDQDGRKYASIDLAKHLEILSLAGNVSIRDGKPFIHAHLAYADSQGNAFGGHLAEGTRVFACEFTISEYVSEKVFERVHDDATGLFLWK